MNVARKEKAVGAGFDKQLAVDGERARCAAWVRFKAAHPSMSLGDLLRRITRGTPKPTPAIGGPTAVLPLSPRFVDKTGRRYGKLVVIGLDSYRGNAAIWRVRCDCGTAKVAWGTALIHEGNQSCGSRICRYGQPPTENPTVACACGCGQTFRQFRDDDAYHRHPRRFAAPSHGAKGRWTEEDDRQLRELYRTMSLDALAKKLKRSAPQTYERARMIGVAARLGAPAELRGWETGIEVARRHERTEKWVKQALAFSGIRAGRSACKPGERRANMRVDSNEADAAVARFEAALSVEPMGGTTAKWSSVEEDFLRNFAGKVPLTTISVVLWRTHESVCQLARQLGLALLTDQWTGDRSKVVLAALSEGEIHRSEIAAITGLAVHVVSSALNRLQAAGMAVSVGGGRWRSTARARPRPRQLSRQQSRAEMRSLVESLVGGP